MTLIPIHRRARVGERDASLGREWRLAVNRDERRTRTRALPPQYRVCGEHQALMPVDPESDGTWVAINDAGLVATMLNANAPVAAGRRTWDSVSNDSSTGLTVSRGTVIPQLMACVDLSAAEGVLRGLNARLYAPFRLLASDGATLLTASHDRQTLTVTRRAWDGEPVMLTSSNLGDAVVEPPRRGLFRRMFACEPQRWAEVQDQFHRHRFPGQPHLSINMSRAEARTVNHTVIQREGNRMTMIYHADAPDNPAAPVTCAELVLHLPAPAAMAPGRV